MFFSCEEGVEKPVHMCWRDTMPSIDYTDRHIAVTRRSGKRHCLSVGARFDRIDYQIEQHLFQLLGIALNSGQV
jgi:hypothetical protein